MSKKKNILTIIIVIAVVVVAYYFINNVKDLQKETILTFSTIQGPVISPSTISLFHGVNKQLLKETNNLAMKQYSYRTEEQKNLINLTNNYIKRIIGDKHFEKYYKPVSILCSSHYRGGFYNTELEENILEDLCQEYSVYYQYSYIDNISKNESIPNPGIFNMSIAIRLDNNNQYSKVYGDVSCIDNGYICDVINKSSALKILKANGAKEANEDNLVFLIISNIMSHKLTSQNWIWYAPTGEESTGESCAGYTVEVIDAISGEKRDQQNILTWCR